jgi:uncharacterized protein (TIGR02118 family)
VRTIAAVWDPGPERLDVLARQGAHVHLAVADQGPYGRGTPFAAFVVGPADLELATGAGAGLWAWRADQRVPRRSDADCAVAMVSLMRRRPGASRHDFVTHWTERHTPLALRRHVGLADYHQFVIRETLTPDTPEIDGIAMLGFITRGDFETRFFDSDEGRAEIMADVARFMDRPGPETTLVGPRGRAHGPG